MEVNDNYIEIKKYRGAIRRCEHCFRPDVPGPLLEFCKFCQAQRYVAQCLKCDGKGMITSKAPWDGSSDYSSVCDICGGSGVLPAKKPEGVPIVEVSHGAPPAASGDASIKAGEVKISEVIA